jgi:hypothetical protein
MKPEGATAGSSAWFASACDIEEINKGYGSATHSSCARDDAGQMAKFVSKISRPQSSEPPGRPLHRWVWPLVCKSVQMLPCILPSAGDAPLAVVCSGHRRKRSPSYARRESKVLPRSSVSVRPSVKSRSNLLPALQVTGRPLTRRMLSTTPLAELLVAHNSDGSLTICFS